jgi:hypothetical protein
MKCQYLYFLLVHLVFIFVSNLLKMRCNQLCSLQANAYVLKTKVTIGFVAFLTVM